MIIETKYNIGDTVYLIDKSRLIKTKIRGTFVNCIQKGNSVFSFPSYDLVYETTEFIIVTLGTEQRYIKGINQI